METTQTIPAAPISPAPAAPMPAAPMPAAPAPPMMQEGGMPPGSGSRPGKFFDGITLMDVGIVALVSLSLFYNIYASRQAIKYFQNLQNQTNSDIAALKSQVNALASGQPS